MSMLSSGLTPGISCDPEKGAKQSFKEECDINTILARHKMGASITHVNENAGRFADVTGFTDYRDVLERVEAARDYFSGLSSKVRARFDNEPASFLDFVADPANEAEAAELGLGPALERPDPVPVPPVVEPPVPPVIPDPADPVVEPV